MNPSTAAKFAVLGSVAVLCTALGCTLPNGRPQVVSGSVECASGAAAVGVWVDALSGGSGWGTTQRIAGHPERLLYRRDLPLGGRFIVHVGCGGTPAVWGSSNSSAPVGGPYADFRCHDHAAGAAPHPVCETVTPDN